MDTKQEVDVLTRDGVKDKAGVIVKGMFLQFLLVDAAESIFVKEPLNGLNHIQLGLSE